MASQDLFVPVEMDAPPPQIPTRGTHPVAKQGFTQTAPVQTNKFYANLYLGNRNQGSWTHPYSVGWSKGGGNCASWGLFVSHTSRSQLNYGPGNPASYFISPVGIHSMVISAVELGNSTSMTLDSLRAFSVNMNLASAPGSSPRITFPLVQGMGFVTGVYNVATPVLNSDVFFKTLTYGGPIPAGSTYRYQVVLADNTSWLIYMTPVANSAIPTLTLVNNQMIAGNCSFSGSIQVAKNPNSAASQAVYDSAAGSYPLRSFVNGSTNNAVGTYQFTWTKGGLIARPLLMFALPHHVQAMPSGFSSQSTSALQLDTTTKGLALAIVSDQWTMTENDLPFDMGFAPWSPTRRSSPVLPATATSTIQNVSATELNQDFNAQTNLNSMYFSGKGLAKFAFIVYTVANLVKNPQIASAGLVKLKNAYALFVNNKQQYPLAYDSQWGGVVSSCSYATGDPNCDFGNTFYNDHHFHYGYFVYTAAVIATLDPSWLTQGTNKMWVNMLVRDYANPLSNDAYFPFSRNFDWWHGHSWAHGLYESADGKDQESSSEDVFSLYALKMWGHAIGDAAMECRANLQLAIAARSLPSYYLLSSTNKVEPSLFIGNKAIGILFENKMDHSTYFGTNTEYIEGIHMIPLSPASTLTRSPTFVAEEWAKYFDKGRVDQVVGGWRGVLYANLAIIDPKTAYNFFAQNNFDNSWLDGGASRTWYLAWAACLGGV